jgi:hypothetical protein
MIPSNCFNSWLDFIVWVYEKETVPVTKKKKNTTVVQLGCAMRQQNYSTQDQ